VPGLLKASNNSQLRKSVKECTRSLGAKRLFRKFVSSMINFKKAAECCKDSRPGYATTKVGWSCLREGRASFYQLRTQWVPVTCLLGSYFVPNWTFFVQLFVFVRSSHHKRKIIDIRRKQTRIRACVSDLSALWKYAWHPKPAVLLIYTTFLRHCNECKSVLIRKLMYCVLFRVTANRKPVISGKMRTYTKRKRRYNCVHQNVSQWIWIFNSFD
jgi:hypothetical protein